jgi:hypothetical protein
MQEIQANPSNTPLAVPIVVRPRPLLPWVELIAGFFGFHGVGLFLAGRRTAGTVWFVASIIKHLIGIGILAATFGLAIACLLPLDIALSIFLGLNVARDLRKEEHAAAKATHLSMPA